MSDRGKGSPHTPSLSQPLKQYPVVSQTFVILLLVSQHLLKLLLPLTLHPRQPIYCPAYFLKVSKAGTYGM